MTEIREKIASRITAIKESVLHLRPDFLFSAGVMPLAAVTTFLFLGKKSVWLDEAFSVTLAQMEWPDFFYNVSHYEANGGFYYFLLHFWVNLGQSEFVLRSLSVIFALGVIVMIYRLGTYLNGTRTGLVAALLTTLNAFFILFAQEARGYMLALLLSTLSSYFFINGVEKSGWKWWAAYVLVTVLGMYTHLYVVFLPLAHYLSALFLPRREIPWKYLIISGAAIAVLFVPMIIFILTMNIGQTAWINLPQIRDIATVFNRLSGQGGLVPIIAYFIPSVIACVFFVRMYIKERMTLQLWRYIFLLSWLIVPVILAFLFSYIKPVFEARYFLMLLPAIVFLVAAGLNFIKPRWLFAGALVIIILISVFPLKDWYTSNPNEGYNQKENWREMTSVICARAKPGDAVVFFHPVAQMPFEYYRSRLGVPVDMPAVIHYLSGTTNKLNLYYLPEGYSFGELPGPDRNIMDRLAGHDRVWLVLSHTFDKTKKAQANMLFDFIKVKYNIVEEKSYYIDIRMYLLVLKEP